VLHKIIHLKFKYIYTHFWRFQLTFYTPLSLFFSFLLFCTSTSFDPFDQTTVIKVLLPPFNSYFVRTLLFDFNTAPARNVWHIRYLIQLDAHRHFVYTKKQPNWKEMQLPQTNALHTLCKSIQLSLDRCRFTQTREFRHWEQLCYQIAFNYLTIHFKSRAPIVARPTRSALFLLLFVDSNTVLVSAHKLISIVHTL